MEELLRDLQALAAELARQSVPPGDGEYVAPADQSLEAFSEHRVAAPQLLAKWLTDPVAGLAEASVRRRRAAHGANAPPSALPPPKCFSLRAGQFPPHDAKWWLDAQRAVAPRCRVLRDGRIRALDAAEVVVGDVVLLGPGDAAPTDCVVLAARAAEAESESITGERAVKPLAPARSHENALRSSNALLLRCHVLRGSVAALAVRLAQHSAVADLAQAPSEAVRAGSAVDASGRPRGLAFLKAALQAVCTAGMAPRRMARLLRCAARTVVMVHCTTAAEAEGAARVAAALSPRGHVVVIVASPALSVRLLPQADALVDLAALGEGADDTSLAGSSSDDDERPASDSSAAAALSADQARAAVVAAVAERVQAGAGDGARGGAPDLVIRAAGSTLSQVVRWARQACAAAEPQVALLWASVADAGAVARCDGGHAGVSAPPSAPGSGAPLLDDHLDIEALRACCNEADVGVVGFGSPPYVAEHADAVLFEPSSGAGPASAPGGKVRLLMSLADALLQLSHLDAEHTARRDAGCVLA